MNLSGAKFRMEKFDFDSTSKTGTWNTESEIQIPETGLNLTTDSQKASADDIVVEKKVLSCKPAADCKPLSLISFLRSDKDSSLPPVPNII